MKYYKKLKKLYRLHTIMTRSVAIMLVSLVFVLFVVYPQIKKILTLVYQRSTVAEEIKKLETKYGIIASYNPLTLESYLATIDMLIPYAPSPDLIFYAVDAIGSNTGVAVPKVTIDQVGNISTDSARILTNKDTIPISLTFESSGTTESINEFIQEIQSSLPLMLITNLGIKHMGLDGEDIVAMTFSISSFYTGKPQIPTDVFATVSKISAEDIALIDRFSSIQTAYQSAGETSEFDSNRNPFYYTN